MALMFITGFVSTVAFISYYRHLEKKQADEARYARVEGRYYKMADGSLLYQETAVNKPIEDIEPAAGSEAYPANIRFRYEPLTQTYRAETVDSQGNTSQEVIREK